MTIAALAFNGYGVYQVGKKTKENGGDIKKALVDTHNDMKKDVKRAINFTKNKVHNGAEAIRNFDEKHPAAKFFMGAVPVIEAGKILLADKILNGDKVEKAEQ